MKSQARVVVIGGGLRAQKNFAIAYLKPEFATVESSLEVALLGQRYRVVM